MKTMQRSLLRPTITLSPRILLFGLIIVVVNYIIFSVELAERSVLIADFTNDNTLSRSLFELNVDKDNSDSDLSVVTIGRPPHTLCQPGISSSSGDASSEWCVDPVNGSGLQGMCSFSNKHWEALQAHVHPTLEKKTMDSNVYKNYQQQFESYGRIGAQQDEAKMIGIYKAHLSALRSMCEHREQKQDLSFGLVLESDVDVSSSSQKFHIINGVESTAVSGDFLAKLMARYPETTIFNLAATTAICTPESQERLASIQRGKCMVPWKVRQWGATAVGYNLTTACTDAFFEAQESLVGCLPSDLGLYSGAGGFPPAQMLVLPLFEVHLRGNSTSNAGDMVHANLKNVYAESAQLWDFLYLNGVDCTKKNRNSDKEEALAESWKWDCSEDHFTSGYSARLKERVQGRNIWTQYLDDIK